MIISVSLGFIAVGYATAAETIPFCGDLNRHYAASPVEPYAICQKP
ncbi:Uncharacterised protein [Yersinia enterocolitica]|nr:Uncharacterised protein [Yersinia enterocolitica]